MEPEHHSLSKARVEKTESGKSENPNHFGKNAAISAKEFPPGDLNYSEIDLRDGKNPELSSTKIEISENEVKEIARGKSDVYEVIEFEKCEKLSCSVGSYGNESSEYALLDFSISDIGETESGKCEIAPNIHFNPRTPEGDSKTNAREVFLSDGSSTTPKQMFAFPRRSSIFKQFDPLSPSVLQSDSSGYCNGLRSLLMENNDIISCDIASNPSEDSLIYFESATPLIPFSSNVGSPQKHSEQYLQEMLKEQELRLRTEHVKRCMRSEFKFIEQTSSRKRELLDKVKMCKCYSVLVSEMLSVRENLNNKCKDIEDKLKAMKGDYASLESDKNLLKEDLNEYENAFSEIHKRYEQTKSVLETYKKNKCTLTENIRSVQAFLDEQNNINSILESRMKAMMVKAEKEIELAKKSSETQIAILEAKVKKAQMKICSLESTLEQAQSENEELVSIYDGLMSKFNA